jgi:hypothetical protein
MKRTSYIIALLAVVAVVLIAVLLARKPRTETAPSPVAMQFTDLYHEAAGFVSPDGFGPAQPDETVLGAVRGEWRELGSRDSTICEELTRAAMYSEGEDPLVVPTVSRTNAGSGVELTERLRFGERMLAHPRWRMGSLRHFPVLAAALSSTEKSVLAYLSGPNRKPTRLDSLAVAVDLPTQEVAPVLAALQSVGWVRTDTGTDSTLYTIVDPSIAKGGALQFVTVTPSSGRAVDLASVQAAFTRTAPALFTNRVALRGPCAATGRTVVIEVGAGKLFRGRPGNAWAAEIHPPGRSSGLFVSQRAFERWRAEHPEVQVGAQSTVLDLYQAERSAGSN